MLGNSVTLNFGAPGEADYKVLKLIREGDFQTEYLLIEEERTLTLLIRHSTEKALVNGQKMDRHNVTFRISENPTVTYPQGRTFEQYTVFRAPKGTVPASPVMVALNTANVEFVATNAVAVVGWEG